MDYDQYERAVDENREQNEKYLECFYEDLLDKGLKEKTIIKHVRNIDFYINDFLNYYEPLDMKMGCYKVDEFLGDWFIRKAMWSTKVTVKENAASMKKFYKCMLEHNFIEQKDYDELILMIKCNLSDWIDNVETYNSGYFYY